MLLSVHLSGASDTSFLVDVSGSMNGISKDRSIQSLDKVKNELKMYLEGNSKDSIQIVTFTDRIIDSFMIVSNSIESESIIDKIIYPHKGNTDLGIALAYMDNLNPKRIVIISDGRQNVSGYSKIIEKLKSGRTENDRRQYFLVLDEFDLETSLIKELSNSDYITLIKSLTELPDANIASSNETENKDTITAHAVTTDSPANQRANSNENQQSIDWYKIAFWIIITLLVVLILYIAFMVFPLFKMTAASAIQKAIFFLYSLPKPIYDLIYKVLPSKMKMFIKEDMPKYEDLKRGEVLPKNDTEKQILDEYEKQTGKCARYKNGEPDFSPVAEFKVKLKGGLDNNIRKGTELRGYVHEAQVSAANTMLKTRKGRRLIAKYVGKNPKDVIDQDYTCWKDDALNPKTPHETIDGKYIMWVPKKYHDVARGGLSHNGGVSMLKSIRNYFGLNI